MELILDTKEDCFLCLQTTMNGKKNELCLRNICRFLQINTWEVLLQGQMSEKMDSSNLLQDTKYNFSVNLCTPCFVVTGKLSSLIHDLEVVRLQVNYYSEVLQKILEKAELTTPATVKIDPDHLATVDTRMVTYLRKNVKLKCSARCKKALETCNLPLVRLNKLTEETVATLTKKCNAERPATAVNAFGYSDHSNDMSSLYNSSDNDDYSDSISSDNALTVTIASLSASTPTNDEGTRNIVGGTKLNADYNTLVPKSEDRVATVRKKSAFRRPSATSLNPFSLVLPSKAQTGSSTRIFKLIEHTSCAATTININQILNDILTNNCHKKGPGKKYGCSFCETTLLKQPLKHHLTAHHLEKLLSFANRDQVPYDVFEKLCYHALVKELGKCEMMFTSRSDGVLVTSSRAHYICYICKRTRIRRSRLRHHLVTCHAENVVQTLDSLPKDGNYEMPMSASAAFGLPVSRAHGNKVINMTSHASAKVTKRQICCPHCKKTYKKFFSVRLHMLRCHPDQLFHSVQPANQNRAQFADSCRKIFQKETNGYQSQSAKGPVVSRQCAYCTVTHRFKITYLYHLVAFHKEILSEKIKALDYRDDDENASYPVVEAKEEVEWTTPESDDDFGDLFSEEEEEKLEEEMDWTIEEPDDEYGDPFSVEDEEKEDEIESKDVSSDEAKNCSNNCSTNHTSDHSLSIKKSSNLVVTESAECNSRDMDVVEPKNICSAGKKETFVPPLNLHVGKSMRDANPPQDGDIVIVNMEQILADFVTRYCLKKEFSNPPYYHHHCTICKKSIRTNKSFQMRPIRRHVVSLHSEKLLIFAKRADVPEEAFIKLCCQVVERESERCKQVLSKNATDVIASKSAYLCYICRKTMTGSDTLRNHFVTSHADILGQALDKLQQEGKYSMSSAGSPRLSKAKIPCLHCSEIFHRSGKLRIHMVRYHPDQLFLSVKPAQQSLSRFAETCQKVLQNETIMFEKTINKAQVSHAHYQCVYCRHTCRDKADYLYHLVYHHKRILAEKIEALLVENDEDETSRCPVEKRKEGDD